MDDVEYVKCPYVPFITPTQNDINVPANYNGPMNLDGYHTKRDMLVITLKGTCWLSH